MASIFAKLKGIPDTNGWKLRHDAAIRTPDINRGEAIAPMLQAWASYADGYEAMYPDSDSMLADDYVLGAAWIKIGEGLRTLLNGECGRLDCGTLDGFILDTMREAGVDVEAL